MFYLKLSNTEYQAVKQHYPTIPRIGDTIKQNGFYYKVINRIIDLDSDDIYIECGDKVEPEIKISDLEIKSTEEDKELVAMLLSGKQIEAIIKYSSIHNCGFAEACKWAVNTNNILNDVING